jgi:hypothetical protein
MTQVRVLGPRQAVYRAIRRRFVAAFQGLCQRDRSAARSSESASIPIAAWGGSEPYVVRKSLGLATEDKVWQSLSAAGAC